MKGEGEENNDSFKSCKSQFSLPKNIDDDLEKFIGRISKENFRGLFIEYFSKENITITGYKSLKEMKKEDLVADLKFQKYKDNSFFGEGYFGARIIDKKSKINYFIYKGEYCNIYSLIDYKQTENCSKDKVSYWKKQLFSKLELLILKSSLPDIKLIFSIDDIFFSINSNKPLIISDDPILLFDEKLFNLNNSKFKRRLWASPNQSMIETWIMAFCLLIGGKIFSNEIFRLINQELSTESIAFILGEFDTFLAKEENIEIKYYLPFAKYFLTILFERKGPIIDIHKVIQNMNENKNNDINNLLNPENSGFFKFYDLNITNEINSEDVTNQLDEFFAGKIYYKMTLIGYDKANPFLPNEDKSINKSLNYKNSFVKSRSSLDLSRSGISQSNCFNNNSLENSLLWDISKLVENKKSLDNMNENSILIIKRMLRNISIYEKFSAKPLLKSVFCNLLNYTCDKICEFNKLLNKQGQQNIFSNSFILNNYQNSSIKNINDISIFNNNNHILQKIETESNEDINQAEENIEERKGLIKRNQYLINSENKIFNELIVNNQVLDEKTRLEKLNKLIKILEETFDQRDKEKILLLKTIDEFKDDLKIQNKKECDNEREIKMCKDKLQFLWDFLIKHNLGNLFHQELKEKKVKRDN